MLKMTRPTVVSISSPVDLLDLRVHDVLLVELLREVDVGAAVAHP